MSIALGPVVLYRTRRDRLHKIAGYIWISATLTVATTSRFISHFAVIGPFSPIHGFALLTYWSVYTGIPHIFAKRIAAHRAVLRSLYWNGLLIAGLANFLPGRTMNTVFFEGLGALGWGAIAVGGETLIMRATGVWQPREARTVRNAPSPLAVCSGIGY
ncbi:MAG: putative membrane protein [Paracoccaceae bacterium]|jgi:uncharacterized membrane protein